MDHFGTVKWFAQKGADSRGMAVIYRYGMAGGEFSMQATATVTIQFPLNARVISFFREPVLAQQEKKKKTH